MANEKTLIEEWSVRDLEDNSTLTVQVVNCTELGNLSKPGIQVLYMGNIINYEPYLAEQWVYKATKANAAEYFIEDRSWVPSAEQYVKLYLVTGSPLKARVEVKTRSSKPMVKEYVLPFEF
jgi:hypothetical protein